MTVIVADLTRTCTFILKISYVYILSFYLYINFPSMLKLLFFLTDLSQHTSVYTLFVENITMLVYDRCERT